MNKNQELTLLNKEVEYLEIEYSEKMSLIKENSIAQAILSFKEIFRKNEYDFLQDNPLKIKVKKNNIICTINPEFDFKKEPEKPRQFSIKFCENDLFISKISVRLFMDENSVDQPDFNRLLTNPYKGMDSTEIEIYERKKTVDYMKKFISEKESLKWNYLSFDNTDKSQELYNTILELYNKKVHNRVDGSPTKQQ
ncbi:MAG: hypothetical protein HRT67_04350 [Flavobacteriaceae bacterium]|nr:hypothetical protein [Flavobacteriaceae bacterium]